MDIETLSSASEKRIGKRRKLTIQDVTAIADRISRTLCTEEEACIVLDIKRDTWKQWKQRNKNAHTFESIITRIREVGINKLLTDIEDISNGDESIKLKPDWRAKEFLLKVRAKRFILGTTSAPTVDTSAPPMLTDALRRAFAGPVIDIDTANVTSEQDKTQTRQIGDSARLRVIPPRKPKADSHPQPLDDCK